MLNLPETAKLPEKSLKERPRHAEMRAKNRYGIILTPEVKAALLGAAKTSAIKRVYRAEAKRYICTVRLSSAVFRFVCNAEMNEIITFLPRKAKHHDR